MQPKLNYGDLEDPVPNLDSNAVFGTVSTGPLQIIQRARLDAEEALRTEDELRLRMAAQTGWLAISTLDKLVAGRVDRCRPPEG